MHAFVNVGVPIKVPFIKPAFITYTLYFEYFAKVPPSPIYNYLVIVVKIDKIFGPEKANNYRFRIPSVRS